MDVEAVAVAVILVSVSSIPWGWRKPNRFLVNYFGALGGAENSLPVFFLNGVSVGEGPVAFDGATFVVAAFGAYAVRWDAGVAS